MFFTAAQDCTLATFDTRLSKPLAAFWQTISEVETDEWNTYDPTTLILAANDGLVFLFDLRNVKLFLSMQNILIDILILMK